MKKCMDYKMEGISSTGRPNKALSEVVGKDRQMQQLQRGMLSTAVNGES